MKLQHKFSFIIVIMMSLQLINLSIVRAKLAQSERYVVGVSGLKTATLPLPGLYYVMYNVYAYSDKRLDENGDELTTAAGTPAVEIGVMANVHRFVWITDFKILGADYGMNIVLPLLRKTVSVDYPAALNAMGMADVDDKDSGLGDITFNVGHLTWHGPRYDAAFALGIFLPSGSYDEDNTASLGKNYFSGMLSLGTTLYLNEARTYHFGILGRIEKHLEKRDEKVTYGNNCHIEFGLGTTIMRIFDIGIVGYGTWQVTDDKGDDVTWDKSVHDKAYALGGEVSGIIPPAKLKVTLRYSKEFKVVDRFETHKFWLNLTKVL